MASTGAGQVDAYLAHLPEPQRTTLTALRATLRALLPTADEAIKYAMPALLIRGKAIAGYAGFAQHCSYFPHSSGVLHLAGDLLDDYATSKGGLRFPPDRPLPRPILKRLIRLRLDELAAVQNGVRVDCADNGAVTAEGRMREGLLHGSWRWYRMDGSLMRTGSFRLGEQCGVWRTFDRQGTAVSTTRH